jgi:Rad3-related DNA helicase
MSIPALDRLVRIGQLKAGEASTAEINGLVRSGLARLHDAESARLSIESRFDLAYNAAHALALAALRVHGYRSEHRYTVFQCLSHTLSLPAEQWRVLDEAHRRRNIAEYEGGIELEESQVESLCRVAREVGNRVAQLIAATRG